METSATKHDTAKPDLSLLDPEFLLGVTAVLDFGAKKYAEYNWQKGFLHRRLIAATMRHIVAILAGEDNDPETGLSHCYHAACELMFLAWMQKYRPDLDNRVKSSQDAAIRAALDAFEPAPVSSLQVLEADLDLAIKKRNNLPFGCDSYDAADELIQSLRRQINDIKLRGHAS